MQLSKLLTAGLLALGLCSAASATEYRFTATSAASGVLGYLDLDSSSLDGTSFQFVANSALLDLHFVDPISSAVVTAIGPATQGTFFDSSISVPTVVGGSGFTGGTDFADGVWIAGTDYVVVTNDTFSDVTWSTSAVSAVPEPTELALMLGGLSLVAVAARRRRS